MVHPHIAHNKTKNTHIVHKDKDPTRYSDT